MNRKLLRYCGLSALVLSIALVSCAPEEDNTAPTDDRDKFVGSWTCPEQSSQNGASTFTIHIGKSATNSGQMEIENFYNAGFSNKAIVNISGNTYSASNQPFAGFTITSLSGTSTGASTLTMNYIIQNGSVFDTCSAACTKQ